MADTETLTQVDDQSHRSDMRWVLVKVILKVGEERSCLVLGHHGVPLEVGREEIALLDADR